MLQKGLDLLEETFPGYKSELARAGALDVDLMNDIIVVSSAQASGRESLFFHHHMRSIQQKCMLM